MQNAAAVILAGGQSRRMGENKALIKLGEKKIIQRVINNLSDTFNDIIVVTNDKEKFQDLGVTIINDIRPGLGPLAGIQSALSFAEHKKLFFVTGCDMPFISTNLAGYLLSTQIEYQEKDYHAVVPCVGTYPQPLTAVYNRACLPIIDKLIENKQLKLRELLSRVRVRYVLDEEITAAIRDIDLNKVFLNINRPEDLINAWIYLKKEKQNNKLLNEIPVIGGDKLKYNSMVGNGK